MKITSFLPMVLLSFVASAPVPSKIVLPTDRITGDYVEARTASVFCGPCHYNGELVTEGRQAIMAWNITAGRWNGVDLAAVRAMASITSDDNLSDLNANRQTEIVVDKSATDAQVTAVTDLIRNRAGLQLGRISSAQRATVSFAHEASGYTVAADGFASMTVHPMPNNECCSQPHLVWYEPMTPVEHRKVGYTEVANYEAATNGDSWERSDENSAFYGTFEFSGK